MTDLNISVPLSVTRANYHPDEAAAKYQANKLDIAGRYKYEKWMGIRQKNGTDKLASLRPEHKQYVVCYINGMKGVEIAEQFNVSAITVYRVLADPLARNLINEFDESFKDEFKAMFPLVSDAVREGLADGSVTNRLKAVDRWSKICKQIDGVPDEEADGKKAESVYAARLRFVQIVQDAVAALPKPEEGVATVIEAEVVVVESSG
ncbi:hypothetical protein LCGC14_2196340 [marine sediment metagenome]|uniref:Uncharacterized protein n=1 Tax=marine sediment metagenome TaxID=412755 RepID=A0A0F9GDV3_9ZZZZ